MALAVTLFNPSTGELRDVDGGDDEAAKRKRQFLYMQRWERFDARKCFVRTDMYACKHKLRPYEPEHPAYFHRSYLEQLDASNGIEGKTLQQLTILVQRAYEQLAVEDGSCYRAEREATECVHNTTQQAIHLDTKAYLTCLGYAENYQPIEGIGWQGLWERRS